MPNPPKEQSEEAAMPMERKGPGTSGDRHDAGKPEKKQDEPGQGGSAPSTKE